MTIQTQLLKALIDAYTAIKLHQNRISKLEKLLTVVDVMVLCVPVCFLSAFAASCNFPEFAGWLSTVANPILSGILLSLAIFIVGTNTRPSLKYHQKLLSEENVLIRQIQSIINLEAIPNNDANRLLDWASILDADEAQIFTKISEKHKQVLYREALKSFGDHNIRCPECEKSPYHFIKPKDKTLKCQVCGNTIDKKIREEETL